mmetsp:Transcript_134253/g.258389  ORF Transcript_134253/g.258389 Transcript_134253/m.258389 type:complete len:225 (-) Transcript_134253:708-1382(-)
MFRSVSSSCRGLPQKTSYKHLIICKRSKNLCALQKPRNRRSRPCPMASLTTGKSAAPMSSAVSRAAAHAASSKHGSPSASSWLPEHSSRVRAFASSTSGHSASKAAARWRKRSGAIIDLACSSLPLAAARLGPGDVKSASKRYSSKSISASAGSCHCTPLVASLGTEARSAWARPSSKQSPSCSGQAESLTGHPLMSTQFLFGLMLDTCNLTSPAVTRSHEIEQ